MLRTPISFTPTVGVAPGTTTFALSGANVRVFDPYQGDYYAMKGLGFVDTRARIRWDIIATIGGGAAIIALMTGLLASAIGKR